MVKVPNISPLRWWFLMLQKDTNITLTKTNSKLNPSKNTKNMNRHQYEALSGRYQTLTGPVFFSQIPLQGEGLKPGGILHTKKKTHGGVGFSDPLVSRSALKNPLQLNISRKKTSSTTSLGRVVDWNYHGLSWVWTFLRMQSAAPRMT